jgi:replicative DNA helicase
MPPEDPYAESAPKVDENVVAEQSTLGGMLLSPKALADCLGVVRASDFNVPKHEVIFEAIVKLASDGAPVDVVSVSDELIRTGYLAQAGGAEYVHHLTSVVPSASQAGYYAGIVREASTRRGIARIGQMLQQHAPEPGVALAKAMGALEELRDDTADSAAGQVRWMRDVMSVPEAEDAYDWVIPGVLERKDRLMLSAGEGVGKTTLMRQLAILSAAGIHPFEFHPIRPVKVLVIDAENSERQWRRASRRLIEQAATRGARDPQSAIALHCVGVMDITKAADLGRVHSWIDQAKPDLLVIGPLYRVVSGSLDKEEDAKPTLRALDSLRERDVAMLIEVHAGHARAQTGERELRPRGSSTLLGWPEFGLGIRRNKVIDGRKPTFSLVRWRGDRDTRAWPDRLVRGQQWPWEPCL